VALDDVHALDQHPVLGRDGLQDAAALAAVLAREDDDLIVLPYR
jgi:hypothetical protein